MNFATNSCAARSTASVRRYRREEVARIGEAVRADGAQVRQAKVGAEVLANVAARFAFSIALSIKQLDPKAHAAWNDDDLLRLRVDHAELGHEDPLSPELRDDEQLARPRRRRRADASSDWRSTCAPRRTRLRLRAAVAGQRHQAVDEVGSTPLGGKRMPAHRLRRWQCTLRSPPVSMRVLACRVTGPCHDRSRLARRYSQERRFSGAVGQ